MNFIYNSELPRLKEAFQGRKRAEEKRVAFLKSNPPEKKDIVLRYWGMDTAGREGVQPKPANIR